MARWKAWFGDEGGARDCGPDDPRLALILVDATDASVDVLRYRAVPTLESEGGSAFSGCVCGRDTLVGAERESAAAAGAV